MAKKKNRSKPAVDWHIDPRALDDYYTLSGVQPLSAEEGFRLQPTFGEAEGFREIINLEPGFLVVLGDITTHKEAILEMNSNASLKFHFRLEGNSGFGLVDRPEREIVHHTVGVLLHPDGIAKQEHYFPGQHERSVTLICEGEFLRQRFAAIAADLPQPITRFVKGADPDTYNTHLLMRTDMVTAASAIMETGLEGALRKQYIEAKALELLTLCLKAIIDLESNIDNPERGLTQRDIDCMHRAREILEQDYVSPPTIGELARKVGVNEAKLMYLFKHLFGQTIFDYAQNMRMDRAKELLESTERSITEIAFDVGYEYSSNFTTAFKRRFGVTPSVARDAFRKQT